MEAHNIFIYLGVIFLLALINKYLSKRLKFPEVTGYVLIGVLFGGSILKILNLEVINRLGSLSSLALGIIAFTIGTELKLETMKKLGKSIFFIVVFECLGTFFVVYCSLHYLAGLEIYISLLLGAVASATAPAATVAVIKQYKAKGTLTSTILAVVGIDDAVALMIYVVASSFATSFLIGNDIHLLKVIETSILSILLSAVLGTVSAIIYVFFLKNVKNEDTIKISIITILLMLLGLSEILHVSELLSIMVFGAILTNISPIIAKKSERVTEFFSPIFLSVFFIMGGAHLDISVINKIGVIGIIYFISRSLGKISGASIGAYLGKASSDVKKYVGLTLLPQVGVALALALAINKEFTKEIYGSAGKETALFVINILLFTTIMTEIVGPILTKIVLTKAGEITTIKEVK